MKTEHILIGLVVLMLLKRPQNLHEVAVRSRLNDPTSWGADQWARLYGDDIDHTAPSGYSSYGIEGSIGFNT